MIQTTFHTFNNGLRVVHMHVPGALVGHFGVAIGAGSANETPDCFGLAHFVEHTIFKGTQRRSSWHIINRMESVGGELNAFTTKEDTVVYSAFPKGSLIRAVELICDLVLNSRFPTTEIDKERDVICDEINSYLDSPSDAVYDDFEDMTYAGTSLGHNILGTIESVRQIDSTLCRSWLDHFYVAPNMVAFYAGSVAVDTFVKRVSNLLESFNPIAGNKEPLFLAPQDQELMQCSQIEPFKISRPTETHQAHTVVGKALHALHGRDRLIYALLTNILGGPGMNSLLNIALRERRGLVYNVESALTNWRNTSLFTTYFGTDPCDNEKCLRLVEKEVQRVADGYMSERRLAAAKKQYRGQLLLSRENVENRVIGVARALLLRGKVYTMSETDALLAAITPSDISAAASSLLPLSALTLQP